DLDRFIVEPGHFDLGAERGVREAHFEAVQEIGAFTLEARVGLDRDVDVKMAGRSALGPCEPLARHAQGLIIVDVRREGDLDGPFDLDLATFAAVLARDFDCVAGVLAGGADALQQERPARVRDLAGALAARTDRAPPVLRTRSVAYLAGAGMGQRDLALDP